MDRLVIVSNRLPVTARVEGSQLVVKPSSGGLATGLTGAYERCNGVWIGWPGELPKLTDEQQRTLDERLEELRTIPVQLSRREVKRFYEDVANGVLWPVFHAQLQELPNEFRGWETFRSVNTRFARAAAANRQPGDLVWIHDYQLVLAPAMLRALQPDARIGFFLHIPFPPEDLLSILPWSEDILRGMLGADLIGFHTYAHLRHFCDALRRILGLHAEVDGVSYQGRHVRLGVFPMGVDAQAWAERGDSPDVIARAAEIRREAGDTKIIVGIDRLDYTKGILRRLAAFQRLLETSPDLRGAVRLIQVTVPSREKVEAYTGLRRRIDEVVGRINGRYATPTSMPIHRMHTSLSATDIAALYRAADVMLVTPLSDGMNLVSKEFAATRTDEDGVLVLSKFAGAAEELGQALTVNPYNIDEVAGAIRTALAMPRDERLERMRAMRARVMPYDVHRWVDSFVGKLRRSIEATPAPANLETEQELAAVVTQLRAHRDLLLVLDYDGTLVPFAETPEQAAPDAALLELLRGLAARDGIRVHLVSGRTRDTLDEWFGRLPIGLHAEHGFASRVRPGDGWMERQVPPGDWKRRVRDVLRHFVGTTPGSFIEEKPASLAWHYRAASARPGAAEFVESQARELRALVGETMSGLPVEMLPGNMVLEVRARGINKANVVPLVLAGAPPNEAVLAMGDDRTDEDLFAALPPQSFTVHVGEGATGARLRVTSPDRARHLLATLID